MVKQKFVCGKIVVKRKITANLAVIFLKNGGPNRDRTDDLTDANRALSQGGSFLPTDCGMWGAYIM